MRRSLLTACLLLAFATAPAQANDALVGGHAALALDRAEHDWGVAAQNDSLETTFTYTNRSKAVVMGIRAIADCGCNHITLSKTELKPEESGEMKVTFQTVMLSGHLTKGIRLISKDRESGEARIRQKIAIIKGLIVSPSAISFGTVPNDGPLPARTFRVKWHDQHGKPFEIKAVTVPGYDLETGFEPFTDAKDPHWKGWEVRIGFKALPPLGMFSAEVALDTDHPDHPRLTVPLSANVTGKVWMQSHTLSFGAFYADEERKATMRFRPRDKDIKFGEVTARATRGRVQDVTAKPDPHPIHGPEGYWILSAKVPADAAPGALDGEVIVLDPGIEGEAPIEVKVKGFVRDPKRRRK